MKYIHVDFETRSKVKIKIGQDAYAKHPSTQIWCMAYCVDGEQDVGIWRPGELLDDVFDEPFVLIAHNYRFEQAIWRHIMQGRLGARTGPVAYICTMAIAMRNNLPAALDNLAIRLGLSEQKDKEGHKLMIKMSNANRYNPDKEGSTAHKNFDQDIAKLMAYCQQDVRTETAAYHEMMSRPQADPIAMLVDQRINDRGIKVDVKLAKQIDKVIRQELKQEEGRLGDLTGGAVTSGRQVAKMRSWLEEEGFTGNDLSAATVKAAIMSPGGMSPRAIEVLEIRSKLALGSLAKYDVMVHAADAESHRMHGLIQLYGASQTGRFAGRLVQVQNLPRMIYKEHVVDMFVELFRRGEVDLIKFLSGDLFYAAKQLIRSMFVADEGKQLIVSDLAQIECRTLAWLAGCKTLLDQFAAEDIDPYCVMAGVIYCKPASEVVKSERFVGKTALLGLGYGMGAGKFQQTAGVTTEIATRAVQAYRETFPEIVKFWRDLEGAFKNCLESPGEVNAVGPISLVFDGEQREMEVSLPSGRTLHYHDCKIETDTYENGKKETSMTYLKADNERTTTWGGKLTENVCQAVSLDVLQNALVAFESAGLPVVAHVHDEVIIEVEDANKLIDDVNQIMSNRPLWAKNLPLACETKVCTRYTK